MNLWKYLKHLRQWLLKREKSLFSKITKMNKYKLEFGKVREEKEEGDHLIQQMKAKIIQLISKMSENEGYTDKISKFYELGIIDEEGNPTSNNMKLG